MKNYQSLLFPYAYNILGSAEDAKDAVQDVVLKYTSKGFQPDNEKNYLIKGVINQAINMKRRKKKMQPHDEWLPEPVSTERADLGVELRELVSYSLLFLLERLNPKERAVYILKEAFAYTHEEIAEALSISVENSRQLLSRASKKVNANTPETPKAERQTALSEQSRESIDRFVFAIRNKDLDQLHHLLSEDISYHADGGGKIKVVKKYCTGIREVAELLAYVYHTYQRKTTIKPAIVNHQPALLYYYRDKLVTCQVLEFDDDSSKIRRISAIVDPQKLSGLGGLSL